MSDAKHGSAASVGLISHAAAGRALSQKTVNGLRPTPFANFFLGGVSTNFLLI